MGGKRTETRTKSMIRTKRRIRKRSEIPEAQEADEKMTFSPYFLIFGRICSGPQNVCVARALLSVCRVKVRPMLM